MFEHITEELKHEHMLYIQGPQTTTQIHETLNKPKCWNRTYL